MLRETYHRPEVGSYQTPTFIHFIFPTLYIFGFLRLVGQYNVQCLVTAVSQNFGRLNPRDNNKVYKPWF